MTKLRAWWAVQGSNLRPLPCESQEMGVSWTILDPSSQEKQLTKSITIQGGLGHF